MTSELQIFLAAHIETSYKLPLGYNYIRSGSNIFNAKFNDSSKDNISSLNPFYSELTALYWIWKNFQGNNSIIGLAHYRRVLCDDGFIHILLKKPLSRFKIIKYLNEFDILLPKKIYHGSSLFSLYEVRPHRIEDLISMLTSISLLYNIPHKKLIDFVKETHSGHYYNMMICRKYVLNCYCEWAFPVLKLVYENINFNKRSTDELRAIGYLAERLFNIWLFINPEYKVKEFPVIRLDKSGLSNLNRHRKTSQIKK